MSAIQPQTIIDKDQKITAMKGWALELGCAINIYPENKKNFYKLINQAFSHRGSLFDLRYGNEITKEFLRIVINLCEPVLSDNPPKNYDKEVVYRIYGIYACFCQDIIEFNLGRDSGLKDNKEVILAIVKHSGYNLRFAGDTPKNDKEIVLEALKNSRGGAYVLQFANENLQNDEEIKGISEIENEEELIKACDTYLLKLRANYAKKKARDKPHQNLFFSSSFSDNAKVFVDDNISQQSDVKVPLHWKRTILGS